MEQKIKAMLDSARETDSKNSLPLEKVQRWLFGYLERYDDELKRFPEISMEAHFDLLMADYDRLRDAVFVVALFSGNDVSFVAGRGDSTAIRQFAENDFPENTLEVIAELQKRFKMFNPPVKVSRQELNSWLKQT